MLWRSDNGCCRCCHKTRLSSSFGNTTTSSLTRRNGSGLGQRRVDFLLLAHRPSIGRGELHVEALGNPIHPVQDPEERPQPLKGLLIGPEVAVSPLRKIHEAVEFLVRESET